MRKNSSNEKKIVQMKNKQTKISNKIVKKHINSSNQMWFTPTPDVILPGPFICLLPWASGPLRPPPLITSADYNPLISAHWEPVEKVLCDICVRCYSFSDQYKIKDFSEGGGQNFWPPLAVFCFPWNIFLFKNVNDTIKIHQHSKVGGFTNLVTITEPKNNLFARKTNFNFLTLTSSHNWITASQWRN